MMLNCIFCTFTGINDTKVFWTMREKILNKSCIFHVYRLLAVIIRRRYGSGIPITHKINPFFTPHGFYGIFISKRATLGIGCTIYQQVTIGSNDLAGSTGVGVPRIGNNVVIGAGAKIIGNVVVGDNVHIGANAIIVDDIPANSTVVMNKPRIICRKG